jgi:hypothetical protein
MVIGQLVKIWGNKDEWMADNLPNPSLITGSTKSADMISIAYRGLCGEVISAALD